MIDDALLTLFLLSGFLAFTAMFWVYGFQAINILTECSPGQAGLQTQRAGGRTMANPSKAKGTAAETAVVDLAKRLDIPAVRPSLSGANDQGDVWLWPEDDGALVTVEVKNRPTEFSHFPSWPLIQQWWAETKREAVNTPNCDLSILAVKPIGVGYSRAGDWWGWVSTVDLAAWRWQWTRERAWVEPISFEVPMMLPLGSLLSWLAQVKQL